MEKGIKYKKRGSIKMGEMFWACAYDVDTKECSVAFS